MSPVGDPDLIQAAVVGPPPPREWVLPPRSDEFAVLVAGVDEACRRARLFEGIRLGICIEEEE